MGGVLAGAVLALVLNVAGPVSQVLACSCAEMGPDEAMANAQVAFVGVVAGVQDRAFEGKGGPVSTAVYTVVVEEMLKGAGAEGDAMLVSSDLGTCGMAFALGQRWRLHAATDGAQLYTGICSGNVLLTERAEVPTIADAPTSPPPTPVLLAIGSVAALVVLSVLAFGRGGRNQPT
jgi:hypothetical protein